MVFEVNLSIFYLQFYFKSIILFISKRLVVIVTWINDDLIKIPSYY